MEAKAQLRSMTRVVGSAVFSPSSMASRDGWTTTSKCSHHLPHLWGSRRRSRRMGQIQYLTPDRASHPSHQFELLALLRRGQAVALHGGGEPALRAERQPLERHVARRFRDPPLQLVLSLERRLLARHEAEDDDPVLRYVPQGLEPARALVVVLEQEAVEPRPFEDAGDRPVVARRIELALVVAAADVDREGHAGVARDDGIVHLDARVDQRLGVAAPL